MHKIVGVDFVGVDLVAPIATECCERLFFDQGEFEAIQTLNGHRAPRCDKHHFHAKMTVIT